MAKKTNHSGEFVQLTFRGSEIRSIWSLDHDLADIWVWWTTKLKTNKLRAEQEARLAHGFAVKK